METDNKYIKIIEYSHTGKTKGFNIINKSGNYIIGEIYWYSAWRQYCFFPSPSSVFNNACMTDIQSMIKELMSKR